MWIFSLLHAVLFAATGSLAQEYYFKNYFLFWAFDTI
jgi:hypothetical protein